LRILDVRIFKVVDCNADRYLVGTKFREILVVNIQTAQTFDGESINLRDLNDMEVRKYYDFEITYRFAGLENLNDSEGINKSWGSIKMSI